ncbi:Dolichyl-phosphate-mannose-protein mannosyltransferase [Lentzea waywayandensis]|uniref:Dolichyl-phosphate-mannose-protein mannosyltransferase n=1 Tax=Lentzea waywayandensis TaxID=84724 RepID=A0A1I6DAE1_9PSEU|nr:glycosyltransferase family 39 protein [Lentzea waywayandensis]SFR02292.1 Dolichyl-phosphate-mannose-protein mannosyltransferase [Lentzea waywayandensis]
MPVTAPQDVVTRTRTAVPLARRPVAVIAAIQTALLFAVAGNYGLTADELYFRMLGDEPRWGYFDQPPLTPLLAKAGALLFGDTVQGVRMPALLCGVAVVVLAALIAAELGGGRSAQVLAAAATASSVTVLVMGHFLLTNSLDLVAWCAVALFALRALLRGDGRWWLAAGVTCGVATYAKYVVLLLPLTLVVALLLVGPRRELRSRWLWAGAGLTLLISAPNLVYQAVNGWPQLVMARSLAEGTWSDGILFAFDVAILVGPAVAPILVAGLTGLLRRPQWRPARALAVAYLVGTALVLALAPSGIDYTEGYLVPLVAAGSVVAAGWLSRGRARWPAAVTVLTVFAVLQAALILPVWPERMAARYTLTSLTEETVGWPRLVAQVADAYAALPAEEQPRAVVLTRNFGEAGALHWMRDDHPLPRIYSGHNELYFRGPPPATADVVIAVGVDDDRLARDFRECTAVARIDNGYGLETREQGRTVSVCRGPRAPWAELWPGYRLVGPY